MSIKIYNGLKTDIIDFYRLNQFFQKYHNLVLPIFQCKVLEQIGKIIARRHDSYILGLITEKPDLNVFNIVHELSDKCRKTQIKFHRDVEYDYFCSIQFYPLKNKTLLFCNSEMNFYFETLRDMPEVDRYGYWDNTDQDETVLDDEWKQRGIDWAYALNKIKPFEMPIFGIREFPYDIHELREINKYIPSLESRAKSMSSEIAVKKSFKGQNNITTNEIIEYLNSNEFILDREEIIEEIKDKLTDIDFYQKMIS